MTRHLMTATDTDAWTVAVTDEEECAPEFRAAGQGLVNRLTETTERVEVGSPQLGLRVTEAPCPQAWPAGLHAGLLRECRYPAKHRGWHRDASGTLSWGGKLTEDESALAEALRASANT